MMHDKIYGCRSDEGDFDLFGGEDLEDVMENYKNHFPDRKLHSVYLMVWEQENDDE
jgi:hypothetical protein